MTLFPPQTLSGAGTGATRAHPQPAHPLSAMQQGMLFNSLLEPGSGAEVEQFIIHLHHAVDAELLCAAWGEVARRHEILRTAFRWQGVDTAKQVVWEGVEFGWRVLDWPGDDGYAAWLRDDRLRGFALDVPPLQRLALFRRADHEHTLVWTFHHALLDGRAMVLVLRDVFALYEARAAGGEAQLPTLRPFRDYTAWFAAQDWSVDEPFWRALLDGVASPTPVPLLGPAREDARTEEYLQRSVRVPAEATAALEALAEERGLTLNAVVQAAWAVLLARHAERNDVVFGTTRACRRSAAGGAETIVGPTFNTVPVRVRLPAGATLLDAAEQVREQSVSVRPHENTPLQRIQEWCGAPGAPLFQTAAVFEFQPMTETLAALGGGWPRRTVQILRKSNFPLTLSAYGGARALLTLTYAPSRFSAGAIDRLLDHLRAILEAFAADPSQAVADVDLLSSDEKATLAAWGDGGFAAPAVPGTILRAFDAAVADGPDAPAVRDEREALSYRALDARASRLAHHLRGLGVGAESRVAILAERGADAVAAALGVMQAGGAYVPLDPGYPADRIAFVLQDCGARVLLTQRALLDRVPAAASAAVVCLDDAAEWAHQPCTAPSPEVRPEHAAYVIYTSGSTGRPKGVVVEHRALMNLVRWHQGEFGVTAADRAAQLAGAGFDAAVWETFPYLACGASVRVVPDAVRVDAAAVQRLALDERLTILFLPTPLVDGFLALDWPADTPLRTVLAGGDALRVRPSARHPFVLVNNYGPTENAVVSTSGPVAVDGAGAPAIGRPTGGVRAYVLDARLRPAPLGAPGELHVAGASLARGYLGRPALTAERFIPDPFSPDAGGRMYATGDRVRWTEAGEIEFLGRTDFQVKVRGFRIEPGEVEAALTAHPAVREAVVLALGDGAEKRLVAYVGAEGTGADALRAHLRGRLPEYMVPAAFVAMERLPLNANGKVDRAALPMPDLDADAAELAEPATETERALAAVWAEVLGRARVGATEHFFEVGGHSLLATRVAARVREGFGVELPLRAIFEAPTVRELAARIDGARGAREQAPAIVPVPRDGALPLSFAQERMWVLDQVEPDPAAYVVPTAVRLAGALDAAALERALRQIVRRHEALRTTFRVADGAPVQAIGGGEAALCTEDLSHLPADEREDALLRRAADEAARPFDLAAGPLYRFTLLRLAPDDHALLLTFHHAVFDGWSLGVVFRELSALYAAFTRGQPSPLAPPPVQYADFAAWQRARLTGEALEGDLAWWTERLAGAPALLEMPADRPRPAVRSGRGARIRTHLPAALAEAVDALARREGATPFMVLMAAFHAFLAKYSGQMDVVAGTPVAGRERPEVQDLVGLFVNTLAVRARLADDPSFGSLVARTREELLGAWAHQEMPFERLVGALQPERSTRHSPVFQAMLALQNADDSAPSLNGLRAQVLERELSTAKFDLLLALRRAEDGYVATLEYAADLWDAPSAERMLEHFGVLLAAAIAEPARRVSALPLATDAERALLLGAWSGRETPYPRATADALFARVAAATPDAVAVESGDERITYAQLDTRATRLARHLRGLGVRAGTRVGLCLERGPEMIIATLAVLRAGGAYVPLDPAYPAERLAFMLEDTAVAVLVTESRLAGRIPPHAARTVRLDADAGAIAAQSTAPVDAETDSESAAYVMYTSGSTGRPKGIEVPHRGIVRLVRDTDYVDIRPDDVLVHLATPAFDAAVLEIWGALLNGARVAVHPPEQPSVDGIERILARHGVTVMFITTALFNLVVEERIGALRGVRRLFTGGEACSLPAFRRVLAELPGTELVHVYGPTENTTFTTWHPVRSLSAEAATVPIGGPLANTRVYVLNGAMQPVPAGVPGELYTGGAGLALGYLNRPGLTAETFVPDPFSAQPGARMYRTGDRVRWRADGAIEFLGRVDAQVKIRGFRVEPAEVESVLLTHPRVGEAVVTVREDRPGDRRLVAYAVCDAPADEVRAYLRARLPEYMVPATVVRMDALPLNANGKVDRRALPAPEWADQDAYVAPRTPTEEVLAGVWAPLLGVERVGARDDFFALGGHSLLAARAVSRLREVFGVELPLRTLFESPALGDLAAAIDALLRDGAAAAPAIAPVPRDGALPLSFAQERLWFLHQLEPRSVAYNVPTAWRLTGALDVPALERALGEIVRRHEPLRTVFRATAEGAEQVIVAAQPVRIPIENGTEADARARAEAEFAAPFDLERGPLYRFGLVRIADDRHLLLLTFHHAAVDGWSLGVLHRELAALYAAFAAGGPSPLAELPLQYADYAAWQRGWLAGDALDRQMAYWRGHLAGAPALLELPTDRARTPVEQRPAARLRAVLPPALADGVRALARAEGATPYMVLLAAFQALLARYSGQDDVVVGSPVAGRTRGETEGMIGYFVSSLPLRARLADRPGFRALLARVRESVLGAFAHQDVPFEKLVTELAPHRALGVAPIFQVMFALQSADEGALELPGVEAEPVAADGGAAKFDLLLALRDRADGLHATLEYAADLFDAATAERMLEHFRTLVAGALADPDAPVHDLPLLTDADAAALAAWREGPRFDAPPATFPAQLADAVRRAPDAVALVHGAESITFGELDARANRLANHLRGLGVGAEVCVGLCLERTPELIISLLAVLKAGGAYVPVEPHFPAERVAAVIRDAGARVLIVRGGVDDAVRSVDGLRIVDLDADAEAISRESAAEPRIDIHPESLAHVIYTSGSTGRPKGVMVRHRSVGAFVAWMRSAFPLAQGERVLASTSVSFDVHVAEVHFALACGAPLVLVRDALALAELDPSIEVAQASMVPGAAHELLRLGALPGPVRRINLAGEALPLDVARALNASGIAEVHNVYGPTEDTTYATHAPVPPDAERVTIGRPFTGRRAYVLDDRLRPVPAGVVGQLYLAGAGVARGYLGRPALTAAAFLPDAWGAAGERMYATGDRARWLAGGELEYLGRADFQVKVRGFRIEPGEVEGVLRAHPSVANAVVLARGAEGGRRLVGYVAAAPGAAPTSAELAAWVRARLPEYMVPAAFVVLRALPATASGKIDRGALPDPEWKDADRPFVAPHTPVEAAVAHVWSRVLGMEAVGAEDDFFALGGHSLLATRVVVRMREGFGADLPLRALFEAPTVARLAARIAADPDAAARVAHAWARLRAGGSADAVDGIPPRDPAAPAPLSFAQERLWFLAQLEPGSTAYNMPFALRLRGALDAAALERALGTIVARHEALRTVFRVGAEGPEQVIVPAGAIDLPTEDLSGLDAAARETEARRRAQAEFGFPFDLSTGPLYCFALLRLAADEHVLLLTLHHAVTDGWSMDVLFRELGALYGAFARGESVTLPPLPVQYADYAAWQRAWLQGGVMDAQAAWWRERMAGAPAVLDLPTDRPRPAAMPRRAARVRTRLPAELWTRMESLARAEGTTPFMVVLAAVQVLLARHAGQDDVVVGTPVAGRTRGETEGMIGMFVNAVALRTDVSGNPAFRALLARVRETALGAFAHQDVPFERLVAELATGRALNRAPVFQVMLTVQNADEGAPALPGLRTELLPSDEGHAKLDLLLNVRHRADGVHAAIEYAAELWDASTMERMLAHLAALLDGALARPDLPVLDLPMLADEERRTLLEWSRTPAVFPGGETALALFDAQAARTPDAVAVVCGAESLTFAELHARASRLAHHLRGLGIRTEDRVGVCLGRTPELIVALLAALKAGAAYVPLDPAYPAGRIDLVLQDAGARVLVTTAALAAGLSIPAGVFVVKADEDASAIGSASADAPAVGVDAENLAHVIYTSGSTGRPKGVMIRHAAVASFMRWMHGRFPMEPGERIVGSTSVSFDVSVAEIHFALGCGATLVLVENALSLTEPGAMAGAVQASMVPGAAAELLRLGALPGSLRRLNLAGEALAPDLARALYAAGIPEVHDLYGPTEDTTYAMHAHVARDVVRNTLGRPMGGRAAYVLDARLRPAPIGAPGEMWLAGCGLARGYLGQPALTAERFLPDPFSPDPGARMYRSGDRGRWMSSGTLEYLGRADFQVKVRGFRIEPGEIEVVLRAHPLVEGAVVLANKDDNGLVRLIGYVTPSTETRPAPAELRAHLSGRLPEWMVPAAFVVLDAFPQTPNGKLDRKALPEPEAEARAEYTPPSTDAEARLAAIWAEVLRRERVGVHDDFFAIGGHSLLATRVVARIREAFGVDLPLRAVFEQPTVAGMAAVVEAGTALETIDILGRGTAQRLVDRVDELSDEEMDRLLATLALNGDPS